MLCALPAAAAPLRGIPGALPAGTAAAPQQSLSLVPPRADLTATPRDTQYRVTRDRPRVPLQATEPVRGGAPASPRS